MYELKVVGHFSAAHNLRNYRGRCEELHGHNWMVEVFVEGRILNKTGMILDFGDIKRELRKVLKGLDHTYLNEIPAFKRINPTSENIAKYIYHKLDRSLSSRSSRLVKVRVWETGTACATYKRNKNID